MKKANLKHNSIIIKIILFTLLTIYALSIIAMYLWAFMTSLKTYTQYSQSLLKPPSGWPWQWALDNYSVVFEKIEVDGSGFFTMLWNSLIWSIGGALINALTLWLVSYLISRFIRYKLSKLIYVINVALMSLTAIGNTSSTLAIFKALNWYDNYLFLIFNNISFSGMYFLILCAYIKGLGNEYYESAYMDGAGNFTIMTRIAFPLTASMFYVVFLLFIIQRWNDYMTMLLWMPSYPTLAFGIYKATVENGGLRVDTEKIAACMLLLLPILALFAVFQKPIMGNLRVGALKG